MAPGVTTLVVVLVMMTMMIVPRHCAALILFLDPVQKNCGCWVVGRSGCTTSISRSRITITANDNDDAHWRKNDLLVITKAILHKMYEHIKKNRILIVIIITTFKKAEKNIGYKYIFMFLRKIWSTLSGSYQRGMMNTLPLSSSFKLVADTPHTCTGSVIEYRSRECLAVTHSFFEMLIKNCFAGIGFLTEKRGICLYFFRISP